MEPATNRYSAGQASNMQSKMQELKFMHHYLRAAYKPMAWNSDDIEVCRAAMPMEAFKFQFLMDDILSLSSLHLTLERPSRGCFWKDFARQYQTSRPHAFQEALNDITDNNCHALLALAVIIAIVTFVTPEHHSLSIPRDTLLSIFELLPAIRGHIP